MGRSQRHLLVEHSATSAGEIIAQGEVAPASLLQAVDDGEPVVLGAELQAVDGIEVPVGGPGGPLSGSTLSGAVPENLGEGGGGEPGPEPDPAPEISGLDPTSAVVGSTENVTLHVLGSNFTPESTIYFANQPEPIVFYDAGDISTVITMSLGWGPGTVPVWVENADGQRSPSTVDFTFVAAEPEAETSSRRRRKASEE